jgi:hypothetical protein
LIFCYGQLIGVFTEGASILSASSEAKKMGSDRRVMLVRTPIGEIAYHNPPKLKLNVKGLKTLLPDASQRPAPVGLPYLYITTTF